MSNTVPVGETLNEAFQFAINRMGAVFRLGWLPIVLTMLVTLGAVRLIFKPEVFTSGEEATTGSLVELMNVSPPVAILIGVLALLLMLVITSGFMATIYRLVALGEDRPGLADVRFDGPALRVAWAQIILSVLTTSVFFVVFLLVSISTGHSPFEVLGSIGKFFAVAVSASAAGVEPDPAQFAEFAEPLGALLLAGFVSIFPIAYLTVRLAPFAAASGFGKQTRFGWFFLPHEGTFLAYFRRLFSIISGASRHGHHLQHRVEYI